jgi:hypothetical protein
LRDEENLHRVVRYVVENPIKAGLGDWPWVSAAPRISLNR